mmetsp:Transcript_21774/g.51135  ORF Transcript_21774/g.51135 Transcript_21774/m.51135 type:complete len:179 (+) Transcript_21774:3-539(+)
MLQLQLSPSRLACAQLIMRFGVLTALLLAVSRGDPSSQAAASINGSEAAAIGDVGAEARSAQGPGESAEAMQRAPGEVETEGTKALSGLRSAANLTALDLQACLRQMTRAGITRAIDFCGEIFAAGGRRDGLGSTGRRSCCAGSVEAYCTPDVSFDECVWEFRWQACSRRFRACRSFT